MDPITSDAQQPVHWTKVLPDTLGSANRASDAAKAQLLAREHQPAAMRHAGQVE
jgi:hypothetical protein